MGSIILQLVERFWGTIIGVRPLVCLSSILFCLYQWLFFSGIKAFFLAKKTRLGPHEYCPRPHAYFTSSYTEPIRHQTPPSHQTYSCIEALFPQKGEAWGVQWLWHGAATECRKWIPPPPQENEVRSISPASIYSQKYKQTYPSGFKGKSINPVKTDR